MLDGERPLTVSNFSRKLLIFGERKRHLKVGILLALTERPLAKPSRISNEIEILSIYESKNGWAVIDAALKGMRVNVYVNLSKGIVCGSKSFHSKRCVIER